MSVFREQRIVTRCRVEFTRLEKRVTAESEDLSAHGVFVRTEQLLPVGAVVSLEITLPNGSELRVISRVAHLLSREAATALGRRPGLGFAFLEHDNEGREHIAQYLASVATTSRLPDPAFAPCRVVVAAADKSMRRRLKSALNTMQFDVTTVRQGGEAYAECQDDAPAILLADVNLPVMDGWTLLRQLSNKPALSAISVVLMSDDASDVTRLQAYQMGVRDFIPKPFTDEEICIRLGRVALERQNAQPRMLRGLLREISIGTLLSLLHFERKSGILVLLRKEQAARVFLAEGRIVRCEGGPAEPGYSGRRRLLHILDWQDGSFEFSACEVIGSDEIGVGTDQLLLEHARIRDEAHDAES